MHQRLNHHRIARREQRCPRRELLILSRLALLTLSLLLWLPACEEPAVSTRGQAPSSQTTAGSSSLRDNPELPRVTPGPGRSHDGFSVAVQDMNGLEIEVVTLQCAGACADVQAVARGGNPPYTYAWSDGTTTPSRRVCPTDPQQLRVTATETSVSTAEFGQSARSATANVTDDVVGCPPPSDPLCITNPSFEGTPGITETMGFNAAPWVTCSISPDIWNDKQSWGGDPGAPPPTDGQTYLDAYCIGFTGSCALAESAGQELCAPMVKGRPYSFKVDVAFRPKGAYGGASAGTLQVWAGATMCTQTQLLWTSPMAMPDWQNYCVTFTPEQDFGFISFAAAGSSGTTGVFVDHIAPVKSCSDTTAPSLQ